MEKTIAVIRGDGIGPEIVEQAIAVLDTVAEKFGHTFTLYRGAHGRLRHRRLRRPPAGGQPGDLPGQRQRAAGRGGRPQVGRQPPANRPEKGLLKLRGAMNLYTNIRPARMFPELSRAPAPCARISPAEGIDFVVVRELIGGVYFGEHTALRRGRRAQGRADIMAYTEHEIRRIAHVAFQTAQQAPQDASRPSTRPTCWTPPACGAKTVSEVAEEYPDVELLPHVCGQRAMQIVRDPSQFDVIVTENLFGDILSDEASQITGSIGMIPSSSMGDGTPGPV